MPPVSMFDPAQLNASEWMTSVRDYGGQYAVLTVQAGKTNEFASNTPLNNSFTPRGEHIFCAQVVDLTSGRRMSRFLPRWEVELTTTLSERAHFSVTYSASLSMLRVRLVSAQGFTTL